MESKKSHAAKRMNDTALLKKGIKRVKPKKVPVYILPKPPKSSEYGWNVGCY